jgi:outer membrane murein-binding lipoprotein Lpp
MSQPEDDDIPPELRRPLPPDEKAEDDATPPGSTPPEPTVDELKAKVAELREKWEAAEQEKQVYADRASELMDSARAKESLLAQAGSEIAQKDDRIEGMSRGLASVSNAAVHLAMTAWSVTRDMDGFVAFLRGPTKNYWPYIIFVGVFIVLVVTVVELPYIQQNPVTLMFVVLIIGFLLFVGVWQSRAPV